MVEMPRKLIAIVGTALLAGCLVATALAAKDDTTLISRQSAADGGAGATALSRMPSVSADGRYVAFESDADNLSDDDDNNFRNIFLRDTQASTTTLVSRQSAVDGGLGANEGSGWASLSADGRFVAFQSNADNLSDADTDSIRDIFVRDTQTNTTTLVSRETGPAGAGGADYSGAPSISSDGRYVAFDSNADNLSALGDDNTVANVFVRDTQANTTTLVSVKSLVDGGEGGDGASAYAAISPDARYVVFNSDADNLSTADVDAGSTDIFLRDIQTNTTTLVSRRSAADGGAGGDGGSYSASVSDGGRYVSFQSDADNLSTSDTDSASDVFVRDTQANTTTLLSRADGPDGAAGASLSYIEPGSISADGRYVAFESFADNLSAVDTDGGVEDIFVRDTQANTTTLVSRAPGTNGAGGDGASGRPAISSTGRFVAFNSSADNLSDADEDSVTDVFLRDVLGAPPTPPPAAGDTRAPVLTVKWPKKASLSKRALIVSVTCDEACTATASAGVSVPRVSKTFKIKQVKRSLTAGVKTKLKLKLSKKTVRAAKRALKKGKRVKATVSIGAADAAGNASKAKRKIRLVK